MYKTIKSIRLNLFKRLSRNDISILSQEHESVIFSPNLKAKAYHYRYVLLKQN